MNYPHLHSLPFALKPERDLHRYLLVINLVQNGTVNDLEHAISTNHTNMSLLGFFLVWMANLKRRPFLFGFTTEVPVERRADHLS